MCGGFGGGCVGGEVVGFVLVIRELWVGGLEISMGIFGAGGARAIFGLFLWSSASIPKVTNTTSYKAANSGGFDTAEGSLTT